MSSTKASSVRSKLLLRSGNLRRLTLWWITADRLLKATSAPSQRKQRHSLKLGKKRRESSKHNYYIVSPRVIIKAIIIIIKKLDVQDGKKDKLFADHVTQVCQAHNRVIVSFLQQVQGGTRPTTEGSRENIGHNMHV